MNGPEHYAEAERLVEAARADYRECDEPSIPADVRRRAATRASIAIDAAQVHATLALAAATALSGVEFATRDDNQQWWAVTQSRSRVPAAVGVDD